MNTGKALETKRLVLVPGNNARDDEPFICRCPEGETNFYTDAKAMLDKYKINDKQLKKLWNDIKVLSM